MPTFEWQMYGALNTHAPKKVHTPRPVLRLGHRNVWQQETLLGLIDTGASFSFVQRDVLTAKLMTSDELDAGKKVRFRGVGGEWLDGVEVALNLEFVAGPAHVPPPLVLQAVKFVATDEDFPYPVDILIGQYDALERLVFEQENTASGLPFYRLSSP